LRTWKIVRPIGKMLLALADLEKIGPTYYEDRDRLHIERGWLRKYMAPPSEQSMTSKTLKQMYFAPGYSLGEYLDFDDGTMFSLRDLWPSVVKTDLRTLRPDFNVPVFILQGADDYQTPTALARSYYDFISAPKKEFVLIEGAGHFVSLVMPERILQELVQRVRPVALESGC